MCVLRASKLVNVTAFATWCSLLALVLVLGCCQAFQMWFFPVWCVSPLGPVFFFFLTLLYQYEWQFSYLFVKKEEDKGYCSKAGIA